MNMMKKFQGANGWYIAEEMESGFHRQPDNGGRLTERQADALLAGSMPDDDDRRPSKVGDSYRDR